MEYLAIVPILGILMVAHELGHFIVAKRCGIVVEEFAIGIPPKIVSTVRGGVQYSLNLIPLAAYVRMLGEEDPTAPGSFAGQSKLVRTAVLVAGSGMNFLVAVLAFGIAYMTGWPDARMVDVEIAGVSAGSPAETAGIRVGDVVREVNGNEVRSVEVFRREASSRPGEPIEIVLTRDGAQVAVKVMPRSEWPEGQGPLGVRLQGRAAPVPHGPLESILFGFRRAIDIVVLTFAAPIMALRGDIPADLVRPIGLPGMTQVAAQATSAAVASGGWFPILSIAGAFSAGLAVVNMLPLPGLDGGRLLFVLIEAVRGRRVSPEREGIIHLVGMAFLLSLIVLISFHDFIAPPMAIDWGIR